MERSISSLDTQAIESSQSAISWGAVIAGALAASTVTVALMLVGSGIGLTMVSPWPAQGSGLAAFAVSTAVGLIIVQWLSSAVGGYLAGRLRTKWVGVRSDEVFFRDTAHGFMAWAVATLLVFGVLGSGVSATLCSGVQAASTVASGAVSGAGAAAGESNDAGGSVAYLVDNLLRPATPSVSSGAEGRAQAASEISRILVEGAAAGSIAPDDKSYLARLIASNTGLTETDANARIDAVLSRIEEAKAKAREAADTARKAAATFALVSALSLFVGAFIASASAALAGRQRDEEDDVRVSGRTTAI